MITCRDSIAPSPRRRRPKPRPADDGFSLLEVTVGIVFLTVALAGFTAIISANERTHEGAFQEAVVANRFRNIAETLRGAPFVDALATYQGFTFTVDEIGGTGTVAIFTNEQDNSLDAQVLGLPRDLDGDGAATTTDISGGYSLLPVRIEIVWNAPQGQMSRQFHFMLSQEE